MKVVSYRYFYLLYIVLEITITASLIFIFLLSSFFFHCLYVFLRLQLKKITQRYTGKPTFCEEKAIGFITVTVI